MVGAGFAGFAAALELQRRRHQVVLLERRGVAGGRATSYRDAASGGDVGSSFHFIYGADAEALELLRSAGIELDADPSRQLAWARRGGGHPLALSALPGRLAAALALLRLPLAGASRLQAARFALQGAGGRAAPEATAEDHLAACGQALSTRSRVWAPLCQLLLHEPLASADAELFRGALRRTLLSGRRAARLLRPSAGFGALHARLAENLLARGGRLLRRALVTGLELRDGRVSGVRYTQRPEGREAIRRAEDPRDERLEVEAVVSAVPWRGLTALLPMALGEQSPYAELARLTGTPAATAEAWLDAAAPGPRLLALCDEPDFAWAHVAAGGAPQQLSLALSPLGCQTIGRSGPELIARVEAALARRFGAATPRVQRALLIRDPEGGFPHRPGVEAWRCGSAAPLPGLVLAGDWTRRGEPASIEAAVRSGRAAARALEAGVAP